MGVELKMVLVLQTDGKLKLEGPLNNKAACYAMLELARKAVFDFRVPVKK